MNAEQKGAWFVLVLDGLACIAFVALGLALNFRAAPAAFSLFAGWAFLPLFWWGAEKPDERDITISRTATGLGGMASYTAFVLGCMGTWGIVFAWQGKGAVSIHALSFITCLGALVYFTVRSVVILVLYGRQVEADNA